MFALLVALSFLLRVFCLFFVNTTITKTVNFELESFMSIISIFLTLRIEMSRLMNQIYFKWFELSANFIRNSLQPVLKKQRVNESEQNN